MTLRIERLSYSYPNEPTPAIADLSFEIPSGHKSIIMGLSGSGKSTFLAIASLLQDPYDADGQAIFSGELSYASSSPAREFHYSSLTHQDATALRQHHYGIVLQRPFLLPHFSCLENVAMPQILRGDDRGEAIEFARSLLSSASMEELCRRMPDQVSGGQRQRVAVLRAIMDDPEVLFADEPVSSLDFMNERLVFDLLERWQAGDLGLSETSGKERILVLVTHGVESAWSLADEQDQFIVLYRGKLVEGSAKAKSDVGSRERLAQMIEYGDG